MHEGRCAAAGKEESGSAADWPVSLEWMVDALQGAFAEVVASDSTVHERTQALQRLGQIYGFKVPPLPLPPSHSKLDHCLSRSDIRLI
jgi:hypothetical protein